MTDTWTPPFAWDVTKAITVQRLNQLIGIDAGNGGNLSSLFNYQNAILNTSSGFSTTSNTFVDVTGPLQVVLSNLKSGIAHIMLGIAASAAAGAAAHFQLLADGATSSGSLITIADTAGIDHSFGLHTFTGLSVGSHTFKLQMRSSVGGTAVTINSTARLIMFGWGI